MGGGRPFLFACRSKEAIAIEGHSQEEEEEVLVLSYKKRRNAKVED